jgi:hypothetical protein
MIENETNAMVSDPANAAAVSTKKKKKRKKDINNESVVTESPERAIIPETHDKIDSSMRMTEDEIEDPEEGAASLLKTSSSPVSGQDDDDQNSMHKKASLQLNSGGLTLNTYSVLYVSDPKSLGFYFAIAFFIFQVSLASLALVDLIDPGSGNAFQVPADVEPYVRAAGYLSLALAVPLFTDLLDSIERIHEGYDPIVMQQAPHATVCKFWFAYICQFLSGALFQGVIFILIVQSTTVIGMLLNFAALSFITEVDDVAFSLAQRGYFSASIQYTTEVVSNFTTPSTKGPWLRRIAFFLILGAVLTGYSVMYGWQRNGIYLCNRIEVQFGDAAWTWMPLLSGVYSLDKSRRANDRFIYTDEVSGTNMFKYCDNEKAWVFGWEEEEFLYDICNDFWVMKSDPETTTFSIMDIPNSNWLIRSQHSNGTVPVDHLVMRCIDCKDDTTCDAEGGSCVNTPEVAGSQVCACNPNFTGNECQFNAYTTVCDSITYDRRFGPFDGQNGVSYGESFQLIKDPGTGEMMELFGKAAYSYTPENPNTLNYGWLDLVAFFGRRYYLLEINWSENFPDASASTIGPLYVEYLRSFQAEHGWVLDGNTSYPVFVSEPLDLRTAQDTLIPTNLDWFHTASDKSGLPLRPGAPVISGTRLVCEQCDEYELSCGQFGTCVNISGWFGSCECNKGYIGPACELYDPITSDAAV